MPVWHASIAVYSRELRGFLNFLGAQSPKVIENVKSWALDMLDGVGAGTTWIHKGKMALHVRRALSDEELEQMVKTNPGWCSIAPQDLAGGDVLLETIP